MITVGTPGLGVRHPDGKSSGWKIVRMENRPDGKSSGWKIVRMENRPDGESSGWRIVRMENRSRGPSGIGPLRVADAQTGRPYSNQLQYR
jgi:hypothetical protein